MIADLAIKIAGHRCWVMEIVTINEIETGEIKIMETEATVRRIQAAPRKCTKIMCEIKNVISQNAIMIMAGEVDTGVVHVIVQ